MESTYCFVRFRAILHVAQLAFLVHVLSELSILSGLSLVVIVSASNWLFVQRLNLLIVTSVMFYYKSLSLRQSSVTFLPFSEVVFNT